MSVDMEQELGNELEPFGADYGRLDNGLIYYVRRNSKPRMRAALALAVKVGYVFFFFFYFGHIWFQFELNWTYELKLLEIESNVDLFGHSSVLIQLWFD